MSPRAAHPSDAPVARYLLPNPRHEQQTFLLRRRDPAFCAIQRLRRFTAVTPQRQALLVEGLRCLVITVRLRYISQVIQ